MPKTRHHVLAVALLVLSGAEVPARQDRVAPKVLQCVSTARSVSRPLQQSRLTEIQESPSHVPSFHPLLAMENAAVEKSMLYSSVSSYDLFTTRW